MRIFSLFLSLISKSIEYLLIWFGKPIILVRRVTEDDYEKVISIRKGIYHGRDYLQSAYKQYMKSPENKGFCAIIRGEMVAFILVTVINDNTTLLIRCVRINERYAKQGITRQLILFVLKNYMLSTQVNFIWISFSQPYFYEKMKRGIFNPITIKKFIWYRGNSILSGSRENAKESCVQFLNVQDLSHIFENKNLVKRIFPLGCIVCHLVPFKPLVTNIPLFINGEQTVLASKTEDVDMTILSIGQWYSMENARYHIDFYGNLARTDDLIDHLNMYLHNVLKKFNREINIGVSIDECVNVDTFNSYFSQMNLNQNCSMLVFAAERKLKEFRAILT